MCSTGKKGVELYLFSMYDPRHSLMVFTHTLDIPVEMILEKGFY